MYRILASNKIDELNDFRIIMYIAPIFYEDSKIFQEDSEVFAKLHVEIQKNAKKYSTDVNPSRIINGPLSGPGEELESPIKEEYDEFINDCKLMIKSCGFTIIDQYRSTDSKKSEYFLIFGIDDKPYGKLIFDFRVSDHPFDVTFPEELKNKALEYLKVTNILNGEATKAGIDFVVKKVTVGAVQNDTWNRALNRAYNTLKKMRLHIRQQINTKKE